MLILTSLLSIPRELRGLPEHAVFQCFHFTEKEIEAQSLSVPDQVPSQELVNLGRI
jgi:hypothetical protein